ncbi:MAG: beta-ketoacyl-ACP synthase III [Planctomycetota bacterium]
MKTPIRVAGMGMYLPGRILTNQEISQTLDTSDEWISIRTGIRERRVSGAHETGSFMGAEAARCAIADAGLTPADINVVMVATFTPNRPLPATACFIQGALGLTHAWCFDLNAACSGFLYCLELAGGLLERHPGYNILVIGAERITPVVDWQDRSTCILFGDAATAFVVNRDPAAHHTITDIILGSDGSQAYLITTPYGGSETPLTAANIGERNHFMKMDGPKVFKAATKTMVAACEKILSANHMTIEDVDWLVPHQANQRIIEAVGKRLNIDTARVYSNVARYGNISAASIPVALCEMRDQLKPGNTVLLTAFGAGLTWGAALVTW